MISHTHKKEKFLKIALKLLVISSSWFVITNVTFSSPIEVIVYNIGFCIIFSVLLFTSYSKLQLKIIISGFLFQAYIFGHAFWILPGKQIEAGLGLLVSILPAFLSGFWMWVVFFINLILYGIIQYHAPYDQLFYGIYLFYIIVFLILKTVLEENASYELRMSKQNKKIEEDADKLRELDKMKDNFLANISHELRTPLTLISGPLHSVAKDKSLSPQSSRYLSIIKRNTEILSRRVTELIEFANKKESESAKVQELIPVTPFMEGLKEAYLAQVEVKAIKLTFESALDNDMAVISDKTKLEIIISNLLSNAIKFTEYRGIIQIIVFRRVDELVVIVKDTGIGIDEDQQAKIFDRFHKANKVKVYEGYGLGLSLVKKLTEELNGTIHVESTTGMGSTFTVSLPCKWEIVSPEMHTMSINEELPTISFSGRNRKTILLVEDNKDLRFYIDKMLESSFNVLSFAEGHTALEEIRKRLEKDEAIDLIISDLMMPGMDGYAFVNEFRSIEKVMNVPILVISALPKDRLAREMYSLGVERYLQKPFGEELFLQTIRDILNFDLAIPVQKYYERVLKNKKFNETEVIFLDHVESKIVEGISNSSFNLSTIAESLKLSEKGVQNRIKSSLGLTPKKFQQFIKVHYAKKIIETSDVNSIKDLAERVGYDDSSYLSKLFKKEFGISPKELINSKEKGV